MRISKDSQNSHDQSKFSILLTYIFSQLEVQKVHPSFSWYAIETDEQKAIFGGANWMRPKSLQYVDFEVRASVKCNNILTDISLINYFIVKRVLHDMVSQIHNINARLITYFCFG